MSTEEDDMNWRAYDFTYEDISGATVEYDIFDGVNWHQGFGKLIVYRNPEGLMHLEVHEAPNSSFHYPTFAPRKEASFSVSRHENPAMAAFRLKSND